ncbi:hypothetical protein [Cellulomonas sp. URHB0016]
MTNGKFGPHSEVVARFVAEVRTRDVDWSRFVELADQPGVDDAVKAVGYARWSASLQSATSKASLDTHKALGLSRADFSGPLDRALVRGMIQMTAKAIVLGDKVPAEHTSSLLRPFAEVGVESAAAALASLTGSEA